MSTEENTVKRKNYPKQEKWRYAKEAREKRQKAREEAGGASEEIVTLTSEQGEQSPSSSSANRVGVPANDAVLTPEAGLDAVTPLRAFPYLKQLRTKRGLVVKSLKKIRVELDAAYAKYNKTRKLEPNFVKVEPPMPYISQLLACPLAPVVESPVLDGYRNKNEFTIGLGIDGQKTAGFTCGRYSDGESRVGSAVGCRSAPDCAIEVAELVTRFVREDPIGSLYSVWDKATHSGFYRLAIVRNSSELQQLMVCLQVNPTGLSEEEYSAWKQAMHSYFVKHTYGADVSSLAEKYNCPYNKDIDLNTVATEEGKAFYTRTQHSLTCLSVQEFSGMSNSAPMDTPTITLFGNESIYGVISNKAFRVNLNSFFQVNTRAASVLFKKAAVWALTKPHDWNMPYDAVLPTYAPLPEGFKTRLNELVQEYRTWQLEQGNAATVAVDAPEDPDTSGTSKDYKLSNEEYVIEPVSEEPSQDNKDKTLLLDICCGTGTIGLLMSEHIRKSVGLEIVPAAIEDAKANAALNGILSAEFVCGKAEDTIDAVLRAHNADLDHAVGIVDPPRAGLHPDVLVALRDSKLKRIIYVSCNPLTLADDVVKLGLPVSNKYRNAPFAPICAVPLDMFPHTPHCEMLLLLERK